MEEPVTLWVFRRTSDRVAWFVNGIPYELWKARSELVQLLAKRMKG